MLRRSTREEINELTITEETDTTQVEERDQQSTGRNELSSEAQKEAGQQSTSVLQKQRFLAVVGDSGSGKSLLARAGLIPSLIRGRFHEWPALGRVLARRHSAPGR